LRASAFRSNAAPIFNDARNQPFGHQPQKAPVRNPMLKELHHPRVVDRIEDSVDIGIQHPPHPASLYTDRQCI
jgi:hypothetical protein